MKTLKVIVDGRECCMLELELRLKSCRRKSLRTVTELFTVRSSTLHPVVMERHFDSQNSNLVSRPQFKLVDSRVQTLLLAQKPDVNLSVV